MSKIRDGVLAFFRDDSARKVRKTPGNDRGARALLRDDRGAMMLMGIFMTTFIVGLLYYIAGIGETIVYRERMQDAADATAMAGAVMLARGMNVIVLLNLTLASVYGILVIAQAALSIVWTAQAAADAVCAGCGPWCASCCRECLAAFCLLTSTCDARDARNEARDIVEDVADATHSASRNLRTVVPLSAIGAGFEITMEQYNPPATAGAGYAGLNLPLENDPSRRICDEIVGTSALPQWGVVSLAATELAFHHACSRGDRYVAVAALSAPFWTWQACRSEHSRVRNKPQRVEGGVNLGDDEFQYRSVVVGAPPYGLGDDNRHDERVAIATYGRETDADSPLDSLAQLHRFSFAQSEYYYDGQTDRENWMWDLMWKARLRRFRASGSICSGGFGGAICGVVDGIVVH